MTPRWNRFGLLVAISLLAIAPTAFAQRGDSGSIVGYVYDQAGGPVRGVKITASSDTQIGGRKVTYTNDEGAFRFSILQPGVFQVKAEAPKMQTQVQDNVKVGINAAAEVNVVMEVASAQVEEVKVVQKAPLVSTTTANVKEVFDVDFVDSMPHDNRDVIFQQITNYVAGAIKGGRVRGGGGNQTLYMMDGFNMLRQYPTVKASAAYEIQTGGYGAENAMSPGGVVNLVTRSGSNKFELEMNATVENEQMRFFTDDTDSKAPSHFYIFNPTVSGPIVKDRLWYSANVEFLTRQTGRERDPEGILPDPLPELRNWFKGTVKLTWQVTARNKVTSVTNFDEFWQFHRNGALGTDREAQERHRSENVFTGLIWESLLTDNIVFRSQAAATFADRHSFPLSCATEPDDCDFIPQIVQKFPRTYRYGNANVHNFDSTLGLQFANRLEFFVNSKALGEHSIQIKDHLMTRRETLRKTMPGDRVIELNGPVPDQLTYYYSNDPRLEPARYDWHINQSSTLQNSVALTDAWRPTRHLTLTPGVAFTSVVAENNRGETVLNSSAISPSVSVAWDATHDGRTVLRASFSQYVDVDGTPVAQHPLGTQVTKRCKFNPAYALAPGENPDNAFNLDCAYGGGPSGTTVGLPCGPSGIDASGNECKTALQIPRTWEYTAGAEREVIPGLAIGLDGIYRLFTNQYEKLETNRIWNQSGTQLDTWGGYRNGRAQTVSDLETPDGAYRRYVGITGSITKREGNLKLRGSYTWSKLNGTVLDGQGNRYGDIQPRDVFLDGPLGDDHRHEVKLTMGYRLSRWLSTTARYSYYSGLPYNRYFRNDETRSNSEDLRAVTGMNPGNNINDPGDDRELRMPDIMSVNLRLSFNLEPIIRQRLELFVDVLNVLALRTANSIGETDGQDFGVTRGREEPLRMRLGATYKF